MSCSAKDRLIERLKQEGLIKVTVNGIELTGSASAIYKAEADLRKDLFAENPAKNPALFAIPTIVIHNNQIHFLSKQLDKLDSITSAVVDNHFQPSTSNIDKDAIDNLFDSSKLKLEVYKRERLKLLWAAERSLAKKKFDLHNKSFSQETQKALQEEIDILEEKVFLLKGQLEVLNKKPELSLILLNSETDFADIKAFIEGKQYSSYNEIESLIEFYIKLASLQDNIIFPTEEFYDSNHELKPEAKEILEKYLTPLREEAERLKAKLELSKKEIAIGIIKDNPNISTFFNINDTDFIDNIFYKDGLPDINLIDRYLMDITNGIFSTNGIIPQVMQMKLDKTIASYSKYPRELQAWMKNHLKEITSEIEKHPEGWGLFFDRTESGLRMDSIVYVYSNTYTSQAEQLERDYNRALYNRANDETAYQEIAERRRKFYEENTHIVDIKLIPELQEEGVTITQEMEDYKQKLIDECGEFAYNEMLKEQRKKLQSYSNKHNILRERLEQASNGQLSSEDLRTLTHFEEYNNPAYYGNSRHSLSYNTFIPKRNVEIKDPNTGVSMGYQESGFYNKRFENIQSNETLMKFYEVLYKNQQLIRNLLPSDKQQELGRLSLLSAEKTFWEILKDPSLTWLEKASKAWQEFVKWAYSLFTKKANVDLTTLKIDPITGKPIYKISDDWFETNKNKINSMYQEYSVLMLHALKLSSLSSLAAYGRNLDISNNQEALNILGELLGVAPTRDNIERAVGRNLTNVNVHNVLKEVITHHIYQDQSVDLPKMLLLQLAQVSMYAARNAVLQDLTILKDYYNNIKTEDGKERTNAIKQLDSWFNRVVLDNYEINNEADRADARLDRKVFTTKADRTRIDELEKLRTILDTERQRYEEGSVEHSILSKKIDKIDNKIKSIGRVFSLGAIADSFFSYVRGISLGWNISSNITNFAEGQISNFLWGERGTYYTSEQLVRANSIMQGSAVNLLSFGRIHTKGFSKAATMMRILDVQQDASNELQKAVKHNQEVDRTSLLKPYELTKRTEFLNQTPVMIAMMLNQEIKDKEGNISNVWDALKEDGTLKEEFRTEENIKTWEEYDSEEYYAFKSKLSKAIMDIHGDYHDTHGNEASEYVTGKAVLMFKKWMVRMFYSRLGKRQIDLESGQETKGRYRSMNGAQASLYLGLIGFMFNPVVGLLAGVGGYFLGNSFGTRSNKTVLQDYIDQTIELVKYLVKIPANLTVGLALSKSVIDTNSSFENFEDLDRRNLRANLAEISLGIWMMVLHLIFKSIADDDDDEDPVVTILINKNMMILSQLQMYINPIDAYKNTLGELPLLRTLDNAKKTTEETLKFVTGEQSDVLGKGKKLVLPSPLRSSWLGLGAVSGRQFEKSTLEKITFSPEARAKKNLKALKQEYLEEQYSKLPELEEKQKEKKYKKIKAKADKVFKKKKSESHKEALERIKKKLNK